MYPLPVTSYSSITDTYLTYYAAFIDGEGHIGIKKYRDNRMSCPMYSERVSVAGTCERIIRSFDDLIAGHIYYHKGSNLSNRGYWSWEVTDDKARRFLKMIRPYLRVKGLQADVVLALGKTKDGSRRKVSPETLHLRESLYKVSKGLHKL